MQNEMKIPEKIATQTETERPESEIIEDIIARRQIQELNELDPESQSVTFDYGRKMLDLTYNTKTGEARTWVSNERSEESKLPNETTLLYKALRIYLQGLANRVHHDVHYRYATKNEKMEWWGENPGREIFSWTGEGQETSQKGDVRKWYEAIFKPEDEMD